MTQGLEQYGETANNVFSATAQLAQTTMGSMTSMANQMMTTGSANVKQFATNFMSSIVDIINKLLLAQMIQTAMGWIGGAVSGGNDPGAVPMGLYNGVMFLSLQAAATRVKVESSNRKAWCMAGSLSLPKRPQIELVLIISTR